MSPELMTDACRRMKKSFTTRGGRAAVMVSAMLMLTAVPAAHAGGPATGPGASPSPGASAGESSVESCVYGGFWAGSFTCAHIWRDGLANPYVIHVPQAHSDDEIAESAHRDRLWRVRCRPVVQQDMYGVNRYRYAAPGCEYGKYE